jgi:ATP phosphoribosyltransferase regulatory subunit
VETPIDRLKALLTRDGNEFVEPPLLHDAELFLDLAGEDLRRRMYLTSSADGLELCLRPDYTIPVALRHLTGGGDPKRQASYAYCGPVFRQRPGETGEFWQAGVESVGRTDRADADSDMLALALECVGLFDIDEPQIRIGDSALFSALLAALPLADVWRRRLERAFGDTPRLRAMLDELAGRTSRPPPAYADLLPAFEDADRESARRAVDELLAGAGIPQVGGRSAAEIAERFLEQAALRADTPENTDSAEILGQFLDISGPPDRAAIELGALAATEAVELTAVIERFSERTAGLVRHGLDIDRMIFASDFGRRLDYYTGFVFELSDPSRPDDRPVAGGGRYDRLLSMIRSRDGSGADIPAVGFALWLDRLGVKPQ